MENYYNGTHLWVSPSDLGVTKYIESTQTKLSNKGFGKTRSFPSNSILVTCIGSTIGKMGMSRTEMASNQQINTIVPTLHDANFIYYAVQSRFPRYLSSIAVQAVPILSKSSFEKLTNYTTSREEQTKIGNFLSLLDERIETQIKIIEDLKKLKSAISNEIFNHTSNRKCELKEIASVIMGQSPSSHAYNNNADGLPLIQGNLDIENGQLSPRIYTSEITQTCECGDVILTVRAPVGEIAIAQQEACIGRGVCSIRPHVNNDTNIIYQFLQYFKPKWGSLEQGSTFTAVSGTDIRGIAVSIPSADKIELLNVYDNKIRVESRILTNLTQQKQYILAQMFI